MLIVPIDGGEFKENAALNFRRGLNGWRFYMAWATPETTARFYRLAQPALALP